MTTKEQEFRDRCAALAIAWALAAAKRAKKKKVEFDLPEHYCQEELVAEAKGLTGPPPPKAIGDLLAPLQKVEESEKK